MNTVALSATVSAVVTVIVGTAIRWGETVVAWARRRVTPDHLPITTGDGWSTNATSSTSQVRVLVCCAPNRSLRGREVNPDDAMRLIQSAFPDAFPKAPVFSMPEYGVRFESSAGVHEGYAWAHASGRVDLCVSIPTTPPEPGPIAIELLDVVRVLRLVLAAVRSPEYQAAFGARLRGTRRRFDWAIAVSPTVIGAGGMGAMSWQNLSFPCTPPPRAGSAQQAFCPPAGFASQPLRNWNLAKPLPELVRIFLRDFLYQNGFHNIDQAVADTLRALDGSAAALTVV